MSQGICLGFSLEQLGREVCCRGNQECCMCLVNSNSRNTLQTKMDRASRQLNVSIRLGAWT